MMKVEISAEAEADLRSIGEHIEKRSNYWASRFVQELIYACHTLADWPLAYPLYPDREASCVRKKSYRRYLIFYRVEENRVIIIHIVNGTRDHESLLFPEDDQP
jgi:toxin ParE1/3/4